MQRQIRARDERRVAAARRPAARDEARRRASPEFIAAVAGANRELRRSLPAQRRLERFARDRPSVLGLGALREVRPRLGRDAVRRQILERVPSVGRRAPLLSRSASARRDGTSIGSARKISRICCARRRRRRRERVRRGLLEIVGGGAAPLATRAPIRPTAPAPRAPARPPADRSFVVPSACRARDRARCRPRRRDCAGASSRAYSRYGAALDRHRRESTCRTRDAAPRRARRRLSVRSCTVRYVSSLRVRRDQRVERRDERIGPAELRVHALESEQRVHAGRRAQRGSKQRRRLAVLPRRLEIEAPCRTPSCRRGACAQRAGAGARSGREQRDTTRSTRFPLPLPLPRPALRRSRIDPLEVLENRATLVGASDRAARPTSARGTSPRPCRWRSRCRGLSSFPRLRRRRLALVGVLALLLLAASGRRRASGGTAAAAARPWSRRVVRPRARRRAPSLPSPTARRGRRRRRRPARRAAARPDAARAPARAPSPASATTSVGPCPGSSPCACALIDPCFFAISCSCCIISAKPVAELDVFAFSRSRASDAAARFSASAASPSALAACCAPRASAVDCSRFADLLLRFGDRPLRAAGEQRRLLSFLLQASARRCRAPASRRSARRAAPRASPDRTAPSARATAPAAPSAAFPESAWSSALVSSDFHSFDLRLARLLHRVGRALHLRRGVARVLREAAALLAVLALLALVAALLPFCWLLCCCCCWPLCGCCWLRWPLAAAGRSAGSAVWPSAPACCRACCVAVRPVVLLLIRRRLPHRLLRRVGVLARFLRCRSRPRRPLRSRGGPAASSARRRSAASDRRAASRRASALPSAWRPPNRRARCRVRAMSFASSLSVCIEPSSAARFNISALFSSCSRSVSCIACRSLSDCCDCSFDSCCVAFSSFCICASSSGVSASRSIACASWSWRARLLSSAPACFSCCSSAAAVC